MAACSVCGCPRDAVTLGMCNRHYLRVRKLGDVGRAMWPGDECIKTVRRESAIEICGNIARIELTKGHYATIDADDVRKVSGIAWSYHEEGYAVNAKAGMLHWRIAGKPLPGFVVDHENRNGLDNRKSNLRHISHTGNRANSERCENVTAFRTNSGKWMAQIQRFGVCLYLGSYQTEEEAKSVKRGAIESCLNCCDRANFETTIRNYLNSKTNLQP